MEILFAHKPAHSCRGQPDVSSPENGKWDEADREGGGQRSRRFCPDPEGFWETVPTATAADKLHRVPLLVLIPDRFSSPAPLTHTDSLTHSGDALVMSG
ncbi:hypothetical protein MHYP_G00243090 [Metynnis hypsauchen]